MTFENWSSGAPEWGVVALRAAERSTGLVDALVFVEPPVLGLFAYRGESLSW